MKKNYATIDGNEAVARIAYKLSEVIAIYPITPSSAMGEWTDTWSADSRKNLWGTVPSVIEMQSEGGAAAAAHGALQAGSLTTTFTSSQGLLLMIPNLYKIAGELTSAVIHVAAEFGLGFRLSIDKHTEYARELLRDSVGVGSPHPLSGSPRPLTVGIPKNLVESILNAQQNSEADIWEQRERVGLLKQHLEDAIYRVSTPDNLKSKIKILKSIADYLVKKSVWIVGGDGWAYDIDFGGLDHVLASGRNVNVLVMDTEVYSNTGGQSSKSTPKGAIAKFAASGKPSAKKDLGLIAMTYGNIYVASVALGARDEHTLKAFLEAEAYNGPSLIIAYSHCIAHGINMTTAMNHQKDLVESGRWLLYRYNPDLVKQGKNPLQMDMRQPKQAVEESMYQENRFKMLTYSKPELAKRLLDEAQNEVNARWQMYEYLAARQLGKIQRDK